MNGFDFKKLVPHAIVIAVFLALSAIYFNAELQGKKIFQSDIAQFKGMSKEIVDYRAETGEEPLWTNSMFGGMPAYQISVNHPQPLLRSLDKTFKLGSKGGLGTVFLFMLGFYILMMALKIDPLMAAIGSIAFAFSSYFFIIIEVGHNSKAFALAYMPAVLAGFIMLFKNRQYLWGTIVTALALGLQVMSNHPQITYYTLIALLCIGGFFLVDAAKKGTIKELGKALALFVLASALGVGMSASRIMSTLEYSPATTRGASELTPPEGEKKSSGLDIEYATAWSYGVGESWTLLVPDYYGGGSGAIGNDKDALSAVSRQNQRMISQGVDRYWGDQSFTSGPVYAGAIVFLLMVIGLWYVKGPLKWGLLVAAILTLMLSWGKNFLPLTEFFLDYVPGYNKFRAVSMTLVIVELVIPILAILGLNELVKRKDEISKDMKVFYGVAGSVAIILILMLIAPDIFTDFFKTGEQENLLGQLQANGLKQGQIDSLIQDIGNARSAIFKADVMRSLILVLLAIATLWAMITDKIKARYAVIALGVLILGDMWSVNQRYLNKESFKSKRQVENPYSPSAADRQILKDNDPYFRVYNTTRRLDQDGQTSYYHKSIGGYHGAKLGRYQELITRQLSKGNLQVINMLNTKYVIQQGEDGKLRASQNPEAMGNAWFVNEVREVADADAEIAALDDIIASEYAVMDQRFNSLVSTKQWSNAEAGTISLTEYQPNYLKFKSSNSNDGFAVFSDIYYQPGWISAIDGVEVEHARVNYVLRGMQIPAGDHEIVFRFEPPVIQAGNTINHVSSFIVLLMLIGGIYLTFRPRAKAE